MGKKMTLAKKEGDQNMDEHSKKAGRLSILRKKRAGQNGGVEKGNQLPKKKKPKKMRSRHVLSPRTNESLLTAQLRMEETNPMKKENIFLPGQARPEVSTDCEEKRMVDMT